MNYKRAVKQTNELLDGEHPRCWLKEELAILKKEVGQWPPYMRAEAGLPAVPSAMGRMRQERLEATSAYMDEVVLAAEDVLEWYECEIGIRLSRYPACAKRLKKALKRLKKKEDELDGQAH